MKRVAIIDSGICNLGSIRCALERAGGDVSVLKDPDALAGAERVVLPGVGSFPAGMTALEEKGLADAIREFAASGRPVLGVCLGMQLLMETGEEFETRPGLGLIPGRVHELAVGELALPHMGWNSIELDEGDGLLKNLPSAAWFYFVHSYVCEPSDPADLLGRTEYGQSFCSLLNRANIYGIQAHPEKSQRTGHTLLCNFLELAV